MWAGMFHLALGNAFIGIFEGLLVARFFKVKRRKAIATLILANYASAWLGGFIVDSMASIPDLTIENLRFWFTLFVAATFVCTLLIEYPFFWMTLRPGAGALRRSVRATLVIHLISYPLLFGAYWLVSGTSMMTALRVVPAGALLPLSGVPGYSVYYLSPGENEVLCLEAGSVNPPEAIAMISPEKGNTALRLFARKRKDGEFDLLLYGKSGGERAERLIQASFAANAGLEHWMTQMGEPDPQGNFDRAAVLAPASVWEFRTGFWPVEGVSGHNTETGERIRYAVELPFVQWQARNATLLEGDRILFQLGRDQICLLHPESRRIALLARGSGPVVAISKEDSPSEDALRSP